MQTEQKNNPKNETNPINSSITVHGLNAILLKKAMIVDHSISPSPSPSQSTSTSTSCSTSHSKIPVTINQTTGKQAASIDKHSLCFISASVKNGVAPREPRP